jgi:hypothetical protein
MDVRDGTPQVQFNVFFVKICLTKKLLILVYAGVKE